MAREIFHTEQMRTVPEPEIGAKERVWEVEGLYEGLCSSWLSILVMQRYGFSPTVHYSAHYTCLLQVNHGVGGR